MTLIISILAVIFLISMGGACAYSYGRERGGDWLWFVSGLTLALCITLYSYNKRPSAMDVYQGKTQLEYVVRDGLTVDSTVVYKRNL